MYSFTGCFQHSIDNKGRINIPARIKKNISPEANDTFIITRGFEKCIYVYPHDEWLKYAQKLQALSATDEEDRLFLRVLLDHVGECQLDGQSRIIVPKELLKHAEIESDVLVKGVLNHLELWNPKLYASYLAAQKITYEDAAKAFFTKE